MSAYTTSYSTRYTIPSLQQQIEVATVTAAEDVQNEDAGTADHVNRLAWANWALKNSTSASVAFCWPVSLNATIQESVVADPTGASVKDSDVQFVVNSNLEKVIVDWSDPAAR